MTTLPQGLTVEQWVERLNGEWQEVVDSSVRGFMRLGHSLNKAKKELGKHGQWMETVKQLKFHQRIANKLMRMETWSGKIGLDKSNLERLLPPDYNTIDKLASLDVPVFMELVKNGTVCPSIKQYEVSKILHLEKVHSDEKRILAIQPRPGKYRTIVIDPAWDFDAFSKGAVASSGQYARQSIPELEKLNLKDWAEPQCHLYCWSPNAYVAKACKLIEGWGFEFKNILTWVKPPPFGLGRNFRNSTEQVLFAMIGDQVTRVDNLPTHFEGPRGEHSEKPEQFYDIVRLASYPPYGEGNQRKFRSDFTDLFMEGEPLKAAV